MTTKFLPVDDNSNGALRLAVVDNEDNSLVENTPEVFTSNKNTTGLDVWNGVRPSVLVNGSLWLHEDGQFVLGNKGILWRKIVFDIVANVVTLEQILLPVLFGTEDSRDCVGEHVGEMTLLFQPLVGYFSGSCFFRLYDLSCNKTSTKLSPVIVHEVFKSFLDESSLISFHH